MSHYFQMGDDFNIFFNNNTYPVGYRWKDLLERQALTLRGGLYYTSSGKMRQKIPVVLL